MACQSKFSQLTNQPKTADEDNKNFFHVKTPNLHINCKKIEMIKSKIAFLFNIMTRLLCFCHVSKRNIPIIEKIKTKHYEIPILNFFKQLLLVIRAKEIFRFRTIYRSMKKLEDFHIYLINDLTFFKGYEKEKKIGKKYFSNALIRKVLRMIKKKMKTLIHSFSHFLG